LGKLDLPKMLAGFLDIKTLRYITKQHDAEWSSPESYHIHRNVPRAF